MEAIQMEEVKKLHVINTETPKPKQDEVLVKIMAVGVCGSDIPRLLQFGSHVLPIIPGHEFAGKIVAVGEQVTDWKIGDKVSAAPLLPCNQCEWCKQGIYSLCEDYEYYGSRNDGAYAQYLGVKSQNLLRLAEETPYAWGATIDPAANAIHAYLRGGGSGKDTVCIFGLGAIGLFAIQYAKVMGCKEIIAVDVNDDKLKDAVACGATHIVNSKNQDPVADILGYTKGKGVSLSFDMSGVPVAQEQAVLAAGKMGRVVFLGISHAKLTLSEQAVDNILRYQLSILGSWNSFSNPFPGLEWTEASRLMNEKKFNPDLLISHRLDLKELPDIFKKIDQRSIVYNKIMFYPNGMTEEY